jgi:peptide/nickel transport system permease protein
VTATILKRLGWGVIVLWVVVTLTFVATVVSPVDPVDVYAGRFATEEVKQEIRDEFGLDEPILARYGYYLKELLQGNLGVSIANSRSVVDSLVDRIPATLKLALAGIVMQLLIGLPLGIVAALRRGSLIDRFVLLFSLSGALVPVFVVGFALLYLVAYRASLVPIGGYGGFEHLLLPALTLGLAGAPWYARMMRSAMIDIMNQEYVRAARARGASSTRLLCRHILPNSINPIVTMIGLDTGAFLAGAAGVVVVEQVFSWPGVGQQAWLAVSQNDLPMITGAVIFIATAVVVFNLLADLANLTLDPRMRRA